MARPGPWLPWMDERMKLIADNQDLIRQVAVLNCSCDRLWNDSESAKRAWADSQKTHELEMKRKDDVMTACGKRCSTLQQEMKAKDETISRLTGTAEELTKNNEQMQGQLEFKSLELKNKDGELFELTRMCAEWKQTAVIREQAAENANQKLESVLEEHKLKEQEIITAVAALSGYGNEFKSEQEAWTGALNMLAKLQAERETTLQNFRLHNERLQFKDNRIVELTGACEQLKASVQSQQHAAQSAALKLKKVQHEREVMAQNTVMLTNDIQRKFQKIVQEKNDLKERLHENTKGRLKKAKKISDMLKSWTKERGELEGRLKIQKLKKMEGGFKHKADEPHGDTKRVKIKEEPK